MKIGDTVRWISSSVEKVGVITHVIPAGEQPHHQNVTAGGGGAPRETESYVVNAQKVDQRDGSLQKRKANYWPVVSLLSVDETKRTTPAKPKAKAADKPKPTPVPKAEPKADTAPPAPAPTPPAVEDNVETEKAA